MPTRRTFLGGLAAACAGWTVPYDMARGRETGPKKKLAVVTTEWRYHSHAWHMAERFLVGYPIGGRWHHPDFEVVSAYVDQKPENDLSVGRAREFGFTLYPTIAEALRLGKDRLAVDGVLIIGEHGNYPKNELGQTLYPRYEFFQQVAAVFREEGRAVPVFNDKHLSWKWEWAKEMVDTARALKMPFLAGSSLPVTWRMPAVDLPHGAPVEEVLCVAIGGTDSYDFHALEVIQCMAERRRGGESGVVALEALRGEKVWEAMGRGSWAGGGWDPRLFKACLARSQTLHQRATFSHRYPTESEMREWVADPIAYRFEYADGLVATMLLMNGLVDDFTFAARLTGARDKEPLSTLFYLPPNPNVVYSAALMSKVEAMLQSGHAPYPVERTLLTSGLVRAAMESLGTGGKRFATPHLDVRYRVPDESHFWQA